MKNNPWNPDGAGIPAPLNTRTQDQFDERDAAFVQRYPLLCTVPNQSLFAAAMAGCNPGVMLGATSDEIMDLANAHVQLDKEACRLKNRIDTLLEKNQDLADVNAKLKSQKKAPSQSSLQLQQQNTILQRQIENLEKQLSLTKK